MNAKNAIAFAAGILAAMILFAIMFPPAFGAEPGDTRERIVVLQTQEDGRVTAAVVRLPPARPEPFLNTVCIREFVSPVIRCYAVHPETLEVRFVDLTIVK